MAVFVDARIPVVFGVEPTRTDLLLTPVGSAASEPSCACCIARAPVAKEFDRLFLQRVRGDIPWFSRVVLATDDAAVREAIEADPLLSSRFRLA